MERGLGEEDTERGPGFATDASPWRSEHPSRHLSFY